ncbi:hypothetical protein AN1V17_22670 [Vallitalea sediminicola]
MKKCKVILMLVISIISVTIINSNIYANSNKENNAVSKRCSVFINSEEVRFSTLKKEGLSPITYNDEIYIPVRSFANYMGYSVSWNQLTKTISFSKGSKFKGMIRPIDDYIDYHSNKYIDVEEKVNIKFEIEGIEFIPCDNNGNKINPISYNNHTYFSYACLGKLFNLEVSYDKEHDRVVFGEQIKSQQEPDLNNINTTKVANMEELVMQLNQYPYNNSYTPFVRTVVENSIKLEEDVYKGFPDKDYVEAKMAHLYDSIAQYMNGFFTRDYRSLDEETFIEDYMPYFSGWLSYKEQKFHQESLVKEWLKDTKEYRIIQLSNFITDKRLVYDSCDAVYSIRGRWQFKYDSHTNPSNIKFEIESDIPIEVGQWYEVDVDVLLYTPMSNAPRIVQPKMRWITGQYIFSLGIENYKFLSDIRKIDEEEVIHFNNYKKIVNRSMNRTEICSYQDWIYYFDENLSQLCRIKKDGSESNVIYDNFSNFKMDRFHVYDDAIYILNKDQELMRYCLKKNTFNLVLELGIYRLTGINDSIYYLKGDIANNLYRICLDNLEEIEVVRNIEARYLNDKKHIYYIESDTNHLIKYDIKNGEKNILCQDADFVEVIFNNWIYYNNDKRVLIDGSRIQTAFDEYQWVDIKVE